MVGIAVRAGPHDAIINEHCSCVEFIVPRNKLQCLFSAINRNLSVSIDRPTGGELMVEACDLSSQTLFTLIR